MASPQFKARIFQVGSFLLGGLLLYLSLRSVDFGAMLLALENANYTWLVPLVVIVLLSHVLRAWRWKILLDAIEPEAHHKRVSLRIAFYSVMIGYMVNYAAPRLGEIARSANVARQSDHSFVSVVGTVVVERIIDVLVLAVSIMSVVFLLADQSEQMNELFFEPIASRIPVVPFVWIILMVGVGLAMVLALFLAFRKEGTRLNRLWNERLREILIAFKRGIWTVLHARRPFSLLLSTVGMWLCYLLMAHLPFMILRMDGPFDLTLADSWSIMVLGAIGVAIPTPGGTGSYHAITILTLVNLFGVDQSPAATYAVLAHGAQLVLYVTIGALSLFLQGSNLRALRQTAEVE